MPPIRDTLDTAVGLAHLLVMLARSGFRTSTPYWRWRQSTAFGDAPPRSVRARAEALLGYARWVRRTRRLGR